MTVNVWFQKISIPPPRNTLCFAPPSPQDFMFQGVFDDPSLQEFPELLNGDFLPPSEIQIRFNALTHSLLEILPKNAF